jgi:hypothetical protein
MEPPDIYLGHSEVMFERRFQRFLASWTEDDLKLKCEKCHSRSEDVETRRLTRSFADPFGYESHKYENLDLCEKCYKRRTSENSDPARHGEINNIILAPEHIPRPPSAYVEELRQSAEGVVKSLQHLRPNERLSKLEKLLAEEAEVPVPVGMETAAEVYRARLRKELEKTKKLVGS